MVIFSDVRAQMVLMAMPCFPMCCMCVTYEQRKLRMLYRVVIIARYYLCVCVCVCVCVCAFAIASAADWNRSAIAMFAIFMWWIYDWLTILDPKSVDYLGQPLVPDIG